MVSFSKFLIAAAIGANALVIQHKTKFLSPPKKEGEKKKSQTKFKKGGDDETEYDPKELGTGDDAMAHDDNMPPEGGEYHPEDLAGDDPCAPDCEKPESPECEKCHKDHADALGDHPEGDHPEGYQPEELELKRNPDEKAEVKDKPAQEKKPAKNKAAFIRDDGDDYKPEDLAGASHDEHAEGDYKPEDLAGDDPCAKRCEQESEDCTKCLEEHHPDDHVHDATVVPPTLKQKHNYDPKDLAADEDHPHPPAGGDHPPAGGDHPPAGGDVPPVGGDHPPAGGDAHPCDAMCGADMPQEGCDKCHEEHGDDHVEETANIP